MNGWDEAPVKSRLFLQRLAFSAAISASRSITMAAPCRLSSSSRAKRNAWRAPAGLALRHVVIGGAPLGVDQGFVPFGHFLEARLGVGFRVCGRAPPVDRDAQAQASWLIPDLVYS